MRAAFAERCSKLEVKGQGRREATCTSPAEDNHRLWDVRPLTPVMWRDISELTYLLLLYLLFVFRRRV